MVVVPTGLEAAMSNEPVYLVQPRGPNIIVRILWFIFIGWWLGGIVSAVAWFLNVTIIGLPLGLYLINRLPTMITLRPQEQNIRIEHGIAKYGQQQARSSCARCTSSSSAGGCPAYGWPLPTLP